MSTESHISCFSSSFGVSKKHFVKHEAVFLHELSLTFYNWTQAFLLSLILLYASSSHDEMEKAMTGMWNLVAWISTHKAYYKQTHAAVCVNVLWGCVFNVLEGWFKNRMFSHSSVSQTHLFCPLLACCFPVSLPTDHPPWFRVNAPQTGLASLPHLNKHKYLEPKGTIIKEVCKICHFSTLNGQTMPKKKIQEKMVAPGVINCGF